MTRPGPKAVARTPEALRAALAVPCPRCGVSAGRACSLSGVRSTKTHAGRLAAAAGGDGG